MYSELAERDPSAKLSTIFLSLLAAYSIAFNAGQMFSLASMLWLMLAAISVYVISTRVLIIFAVIHIVMLAFFMMGYYVDVTGNATSRYLRTIATCCVLSALVFAYLSGETRKGTRSFVADQVHIGVHRLAIVAIAVWSLVSIVYIERNDVRDIRYISSFNYLTISDLVALFGISVLCRRNISFLESIVVVGVCTISILILGSRASMVLFCGVSFFWMIAKFKFLALISLSGLSLLFVSVFMFMFGGATWLFRVSTLFNLQADLSLERRGLFLIDFFHRLLEMPQCLLIPCQPEPGRYSHNVFSVIEYFGIFGIFLLLLYVVFILCGARRMLSSPVFPLFAYSMASIFLFRAWTFIVFAVSLGFLVLFFWQRLSSGSAAAARSLGMVDRPRLE